MVKRFLAAICAIMIITALIPSVSLYAKDDDNKKEESTKSVEEVITTVEPAVTSIKKLLKKEATVIPLSKSVIDYGCAVKGSLATLMASNGIAFDVESYAVDTAEKSVNAVHEAEYKKIKWNTNFKKSDLKYMSCIIFCESRGMNRDAQIAVGNVVLNRMRDNGTWAHVTTIKEVIYDKGPKNDWGTQFAPTKDGSLKKALALYDSMDESVYKIWEIEEMNKAIESAKAVLCGERIVPESFFYFTSKWSKVETDLKKYAGSYVIYDDHIYYGHETLDAVLGL